MLIISFLASCIGLQLILESKKEHHVIDHSIQTSLVSGNVIKLTSPRTHYMDLMH